MATEQYILLLGGSAVVVVTAVLGLALRRAIKPSTNDKRPLHEISMAAGPDVSVPQIRRTRVVTELMSLATERLGNRAGRVHKILLDADPTPEGLLAAVARIETLPLLFVDQEFMEALATEMRAKIRTDPRL